MDRIAARRERVPGVRGSSRLVVTGIAVALGATSFVVANAADIRSRRRCAVPAPRRSAAPPATTSSSGPAATTSSGAAAAMTSSPASRATTACVASTATTASTAARATTTSTAASAPTSCAATAASRDTCLNGEQRTGCELVGTTTPPPTTPPTTPLPPHGSGDHGPADDRSADHATHRLAVSPPCPSEPRCRATSSARHGVRRMSENRPENATYNATQRHDCQHDVSPGDRQLHRDHRRDPPMGRLQVGHRRGPRPCPDRRRVVVGPEGWRRPDLDPANCHPTCARPADSARSRSASAGPLPLSRECVRGRQRQSARRRTTSTTRTRIGGRASRANSRGSTPSSAVPSTAAATPWAAPACGSRDAGARRPPVQYIARVDEYLRNKIWTQANFGPVDTGRSERCDHDHGSHDDA